MTQSNLFNPNDLSKVGILNSANRLMNDGFLTLLCHIDALPEALPSPSTLEKDFSTRHNDNLHRKGFLARRRITRAVLAAALDISADDIEIGASASGAPLLLAPPGLFHLSFAARGKRALIGIARRPIGVDLEIVSPDMQIPWNMLRADERATLAELPRPQQAEAFCRLWSAKEAIVKALGCGFRLPPEAIRLKGWPHDAELTIVAIDAPPNIFDPENGSAWPQMGLKLQSNMVEAEGTGGLVVAAARIA